MLNHVLGPEGLDGGRFVRTRDGLKYGIEKRRREEKRGGWMEWGKR